MRVGPYHHGGADVGDGQPLACSCLMVENQILLQFSGHFRGMKRVAMPPKPVVTP